jgi:hypothetical protein
MLLVSVSATCRSRRIKFLPREMVEHEEFYRDNSKKLIVISKWHDQRAIR